MQGPDCKWSCPCGFLSEERASEWKQGGASACYTCKLLFERGDPHCKRCSRNAIEFDQPWNFQESEVPPDEAEWLERHLLESELRKRYWSHLNGPGPPFPTDAYPQLPGWSQRTDQTRAYDAWIQGLAAVDLAEACREPRLFAEAQEAIQERLAKDLQQARYSHRRYKCPSCFRFSLTFSFHYPYIIGRHSHGLELGAAPPALARPLDRYFHRAATEEAASVFSFRRLARELEAFGAPIALVVWAKRAAREEAEHARMMLACMRTRTKIDVRAVLPTRRDLFEVLAENCVEGCAGEQFNASIAAHQAQHAAAVLQPVFARIARDETEHAKLAHAVWAWGETQIDATARKQLQALYEQHIATHHVREERDLSEAERAYLGLTSIRVHAVARTVVSANL
jgi:hypothetical protein